MMSANLGFSAVTRQKNYKLGARASQGAFDLGRRLNHNFEYRKICAF